VCVCVCVCLVVWVGGCVCVCNLETQQWGGIGSIRSVVPQKEYAQLLLKRVFNTFKFSRRMKSSVDNRGPTATEYSQNPYTTALDKHLDNKIEKLF